MKNGPFEVRQCLNPQCRLRYTLGLGESQGQRCPNCHSDTRRLGEPYEQLAVPAVGEGAGGPVLEVLLDNIRSAWNVGSMLRAADGAGVRRVHLCGITPRPDHPKVMKTALGAEQSLAWSYHADGLDFCQSAREQGYQVWALEGGPRAVSLFQLEAQPDRPLLLVVGNEVTGVDPGILAECAQVACLPMSGVKGSLNVAVAFGTAVYQLRYGGGRSRD